MPVTLDQGEGLCVLRFDGEITISHAADLKVLLVQALASGKNLRLDLQAVTDIDITTLQLLWATERETRGSGCGFVLEGPLLEEVSVTAHDAGFEKFPLQLDTR